MNLILFVFLYLGCISDQPDPTKEATISEDDTGFEDEEIPTGPIPGPDGTEAIPEETDFDWSTVGTDRIGDSFP